MIEMKIYVCFRGEIHETERPTRTVSNSTANYGYVLQSVALTEWGGENGHWPTPPDMIDERRDEKVIEISA